MQLIRQLDPKLIDVIREETSSQLEDWARKSDLPTYTERWFGHARDEAFKSNFHTSKVGCILVYKNHIISRGHNQVKTDPLQKQYNQKYRDWTSSEEFSTNCGHTLHAEIDAIKNVPFTISSIINWKRVGIYIYRVAPGLEGYSGLALPCPACANAISDLGILKAYYTTGKLEKPFGCCDL